ncbi:putative PAN domain-containing protein [Neospora caninum Liverpool]|uniref:PAN domain-containing protein, putative n=1 Tax=Neospora caninum (strain Liverpool) TaxID=572307 RepID=F0V833_NEOCL|nr:putative PAN domain-containing protein [Neospora caninum Liverpool]CBZ49874.1 putative PAN domain-containing protein [Neospora caninum Liverpool]CEL64463.1 TPA: PAN domain-containing protein, putative [Neospora caninum Liverpool]|eukprot:XP_003879909.1 putative PAN domain-containing protein [Neospora caninum Liverpool]
MARVLRFSSLANRPRLFPLILSIVLSSQVWQTVMHQNSVSFFQWADAIAPTQSRQPLTGVGVAKPLRQGHLGSTSAASSPASEKAASGSPVLPADVDPLKAVSFAATRSTASAVTTEYRCYRVEKGSNATTVETREEVVAEEDCQRACRTRKDCTHAVLNKAQRTCQLKTGFFDVADGDADTVSMPRSCNSSCLAKNTHASVKELMSAKVMYSPFECLIWCTTQAQCKYWDYNILNSKCFLKGEGSQNQKKEFIGSVFGTTEWCPDDDTATDSSAAQGWTTSGSCMHPQNTKAGGSPFKEIANTSNADICQKHCKKMQSCRYFTYDRNTKFCGLFSGNAWEVSEAAGYVAGPRSCNQTCFLEGQKYQKGELSSQLMYSALDCQVLCQTVSGCEYFSFTKATKMCQLFTGDAKSTELATTGSTSGPKDWCS